MKAKMIRGNELDHDTQAECLRRYVHRYTKEHRPHWTQRLRPDGKPYPVHFESDAEWLANTTFAVTKQRRLDERVSHCISSPTWPENPKLR